MTRKVNSDVLENFFSYTTKGMVGANNHMSPMEFKYSLRWYLLGKHSSAVFTEHRNTQDTDEECLVNCLIASTIQQANILNNDDLSMNKDITDSTLAVIENDYGSMSKIEVPKHNMMLLKDFENELPAKDNPQIDDCLEYVTGSVARKFIHKYHDLGENLGDPDINLNSTWTEYINKGYLIKPSAKLIEAATILETIFKDFHTCNSLNKSPGVMKTVADELEKRIKNKINIPYEVLHCLVRTRTFIILNNLNNELSNKVITTKRSKIKKFTS